MGLFASAALPVVLAAAGVIQPGERVKVGAPSSITVSGTLGSEPFRCRSTAVSGGGELRGPSGTFSDVPPVRRFSIRVPVRSFVCNDDFVTLHFRNALQDGRYPTLAFQLIRFDTVPSTGGQSFRIQAHGELVMRGRAVPMLLPISGEGFPDGALEMSGTFDVAPVELGLDDSLPLVTVGFDIRIRNAEAPDLIAQPPSGSPADETAQEGR